MKENESVKQHKNDYQEEDGDDDDEDSTYDSMMCTINFQVKSRQSVSPSRFLDSKSQQNKSSSLYVKVQMNPMVLKVTLDLAMYSHGIDH